MSDDERRCLRCKGPLPPPGGPGRPRKYCVPCNTPAHTDSGRYAQPKPLPVDRPRTLPFGDPEPTMQVDDLVVQVANPYGLDAAGLKLLAEYDGEPLSPLHFRLLVEACRLADRMEKYHRLLRGDAKQWAVMRIDEDIREVAPDVPEIHVKIIITSVVQEARHTAAGLKAIIAELRLALRMAIADDESASGGAADPLDAILNTPDELASRRADRRGA